MYKLIHEIIISDKETGKEKIVLPYVSSVEIVSSRDNITETAKITFPQRMYILDKKLTDYIKTNDTISIRLGYAQYGLILEFEGFINKITPKTQTILECENLAFKFKQIAIKQKNFYNVKLSTLLETYFDGDLKIIDANIGSWSIGENSTLIKLLNEIKNKFKFFMYFQEKTLFANYELKKEADKTVLLSVTENIPLNKLNFEVTDKDTYFPYVKGLSEQTDGSSVVLYAKYNDIGNVVITKTKPDGTENLFQIPGLSENELSKLIESRLLNYYQTGGKGTVLTFGYPSVKHGDYAQIESSNNKDENGKYQITGIIKTFSVAAGYKQTISIGKKLSE